MSEPREITVPKDHELRIYVPLDEPHPNRSQGTGASVRLLGGGARGLLRAEVFGSQMMPQTRYYLQRGSTVVIYAWSEVRIALTGSDKLLSPSSWWIGADGMHAKPLVEYQSILKDARDAAKARRDALIAEVAAEAAANGLPAPNASTPLPPFAGGPRVLICGKESSGKHSAMKTLANFAARQGHPTTIVDLNPTTQIIGLPGTMGTCVAEYPLTPSEVHYDHCPAVSYMAGTLAPQALETASTFSSSEGMKTIAGAAAHYARLLAGRVVARLGPSTTTVEGAYLAPQQQVLNSAMVAAAAGQTATAPSSSIAGGSSAPIPAAPAAVARSNAVVAGAIVTAPNVQGRDGALFCADLIRAYGITHVLCIGDGQLYAHLQHVMRDEELMWGGRQPTMPAYGLSTSVGIGSGDAARDERPASLLSTFAGVRFDFLSLNPAICPRSAQHIEKFNEQRCVAHFHGNGLVKYVPIRYRRAHDTMSVWQIATKAEGDSANAAVAVVNPLAVKNINGKVTSLRYGKKDLTGLAGRLCAIVDLVGGASEGDKNADGAAGGAAAAGGGGAAGANSNKVVQSSLTNAPILCYAQMMTPDLVDANMLVAAPENVLDGIKQLAVVVGEFAYTQVYQE